jgi:hypothetical protein
LRGLSFARVSPVELNDFDIDIFLPALFFKVLASGRSRGRRLNDPTAIAAYIDRLAEHEALEGFDAADGRRVLERMVHTALIVTGAVGETRRSRQILSIVPYTLLAHKPGLPGESSRQRNADTLIYQALRERLGGDHAADAILVEHFKRVFGRAVTIGPVPVLGGAYNGEELDTLARLSVAFLDGMQAVGVGQPAKGKPEPGACPALAKQLAEDLLRFLFAYYDRMPSQAFTHHLLGLINFELFTFTLKLVNAVNALAADSSVLHPAMQESFVSSPPQIYLDFTGLRAGLSFDMAAACVRRDMEAYQAFHYSNLLLRQIDRYVEALSRDRRRKALLDARLDAGSGGPRYLQALLQLQYDPEFGPALEASARNDEGRIREENKTTGDDEEADNLEWLDNIAGSAETDIGRVVTLLAEGQIKKAQQFVQWYRGTGGLTKEHGVLAGTPSNRNSWRYAPSNDLLAVLVQLAAACLSTDCRIEVDGSRLAPFRLTEFLAFLEQRFGILVDRPPDNFEGADYSAAARDNLRAMESRLRQMGIFRDLSDDFTVQRLTPPYASGHRPEPEAAS